MKTALALCLILGTSAPLWAQEVGQPVHVTPFEVLDSHPLCKGPGKIAFQVRFTAPTAPVRFAVAGQEKTAKQRCSIKTRRGGQTQEIPVPCPEAAGSDLVAQRSLDALPRQATLSGSVVGCLGLTEVSLVAGNWALQIATQPAATPVSGDLSSPAATFLYAAPKLFKPDGKSLTPRTGHPVLAVVLDGAAITLPDRPDDQLRVSSYAVFAPASLDGEICGTDGCRPLKSDARWAAYDLAGQTADDVIRFVEGE